MNPSVSALRARLIDQAAQPYRNAGRFAWHFARGKLGGDPAFTGLLERGLIPDNARVLDLGCGQGLLAAWLRAAEAAYATGQWPASWPPPPRTAALRGIELMPRDVERARAALGSAAEFVQGDICATPFEACDAVVILDVLHYIDYAAQEAVLRRVREALSPNGVLLLRIGDADAGLPFRISNWVDHVVTFIRGHRLSRLYCRPLKAWLTLLEEIGFSTEAVPMHAGTPFANILLVARKRP